MNKLDDFERAIVRPDARLHHRRQRRLAATWYGRSYLALRRRWLLLKRPELVEKPKVRAA